MNPDSVTCYLSLKVLVDLILTTDQDEIDPVIAFQKINRCRHHDLRAVIATHGIERYRDLFGSAHGVMRGYCSFQMQ